VSLALRKETEIKRLLEWKSLIILDSIADRELFSVNKRPEEDWRIFPTRAIKD